MLSDEVLKSFSIIFHVLKNEITGKNTILVRVSLLSPDKNSFTQTCSTPILKPKRLHTIEAYPPVVFGLFKKCVSNAYAPQQEGESTLPLQ